MSDLMTGKFAYSHNEEHYYGAFDSFDEAKREALDVYESAWVGECRKPDVLGAIDGERLIDDILCQDDFSIDAAGEGLSATRDQMIELDDMLRETFRQWLDKHDLWPTFYVVENAKRVTREAAAE